MKEHEMEALVRAVAHELGMVRSGGGAVAAAPAATHEVPDLGWRMPAPSRRPGGEEGRPSPSVTAAAARGVATPAPASIASYVDHTLLKAEATADEIDRLCDEAVQHGFAAVCINGVWVARCVKRIGAAPGCGVKVATVVGFPLGAVPPSVKATETATLVGEGADEIDMVAAIGHIRDGAWDHVERDIAAVVRAADGRPVKVILETAALEPLAIVRAAALAQEAGAAFVKTSTGFHPAGGATPEAVALLRLAVGDALGVKASGGVRDCAGALRMMAAGATRIGTSSGVAFVDCLGSGPLPLATLLDDPAGHAAGCRSGACGAVY